MKVLRPHQEKALRLLRQSLHAGSKRPLVMAPTGAGKTTIAATMINGALAKGRRVIFTVPKISLVDQTAKEFYAEGIRDIGVMQADHPMTNPSRPVQIASMQTLARRAIPPADLVIVDEAHLVFSFLEGWMTRDEWLDVPFVGLSATPWTKGLGRLYDRLIIAATTQELIDLGYLSPFRVFAPSHPDLSKVGTVQTEYGADYNQRQLSAVMSDKALVADIVRTWLEKGEGRPTLCFAVDRLHAATLQAQFQAAGVTCGYVDMNTTKEEREEVRRKFHSGEMQVVASVDCLSTGVDWDVRCVILARSMKSEMRYVQSVGRALRTAPGKAFALVLDHSDTTLRLGFVTDIHHDRLDDGTMGDKADAAGGEAEPPKPKECPKCHYVRPPKVPTCPSCGHVAEKVSGVEVKEGELVEATARREAMIAEQVAFMAQLRRYQAAKGKPDTWTLAQFRARFKAWPNDNRVRTAQAAAEMTPEFRNWITGRNIRFAKGRAKAGVAA